MGRDESSHPELDRLAEEFVARTRRGEAPEIASYAAAHPQLAGDIEDLFPLLLDLEVGRTADAPPARELGDYLVLGEIGRGGMGVVYEAVQTTLRRRVALKILPQQMTLDPRYLERFRLEAQAAARLQHPNIVPVIGWGEHEGTYYYSMQYVEGSGLDEVIAHVRRLSGTGIDSDTEDDSGSALAHRMMSAAWNDEEGEARPRDPHRGSSTAGRTYYDNAVRLMLSAADGIAAAHARGVLHRDVKPSNLLLDDKGVLWISDFGLCKETASGGLTQPGDLLGTFRYMAPERFEGVSDVQADVYGLGITLYELLTREQAYRGDDRAALAAQIVNTAPVRPRKLDAGIPRDLELIVLKAIARDRSQRYATADALAADLRSYLEQRPISARAPTLGYVLRSKMRRHKGITLIVAVAVTLLAASSAYYVIRLSEQESVARFGQYVADIAAAETALRDRDVPVARRLLEAAPEEHRSWEWHHLRSRLDRSLRSFPRWDWPVKCVVHSPDGRLLASASGPLTRVHDNATTDLVKQLRHAAEVRAVAWHPDGDALAVGTSAGLEVWSWPDAELLLERRIGVTRDVRFSPDGTRLVAGGHDGVLRVWDVATQQDILSHGLHSQIYAVAFDPTSARVAAGTWDARVSLIDMGGNELVWSRRCGRLGVTSVAFVGEDLVAAPSSDGHVEILSATDGELVHVLGHEQRPVGVAASPDDRSLLTWGSRWIQIWDARVGERHVTYGSDGDTRCGCFHPDGTRVITGGVRGSIHEWLVPRDRDPDLCSGEFSNVMTLDVAPAGASFVTGGDSRVLRVWDAKTNEETRNWIGHRASINCVRYSPDGEWVASGDFGGEVLVWHVGTDRLVHRLTAIAEGDYARGPWASGIAFSVDSERLFTGGEDGALCVWDVREGARQVRLPLTEVPIESLATSHDGRRLAIGDSSGVVRILSADDFSVRHVLSGHTGQVAELAFQRGDRLLASASWDRTVRLWDVASGKAVRTLRTIRADSAALADAFMSVDFLPDGSRVVASGVDCSAKLWDTESGRLVATLRGEHGWMECARFSPDAGRLVTGEDLGVVRVWETRPLRDRLVARRPDPQVQTEARSVLDELSRSIVEPDALIEAVTTREGLPEAVREVALRSAYRARGSEEALIERLWRKLLPSELDPLEREITFGLADGLARLARHASLQDGRRETLYALGAYRVGRYQRVLAWQHLTVLLNEGQAPELYALDLAVLCMAHARLGDLGAARARMQDLEALLAREPSVREARGVAALLAEARETLD